MSISSLLNSSASVRRYSETTDKLGGISKSFTTVSTIAVRVRAMNAEERQVNGVNGVVSTHLIYTVPASDVNEKDELIIGSETYRVNFVFNDSSGSLRNIEATRIR